MIKLSGVSVEYPTVTFTYEDTVFQPKAVTCMTGKNGYGKTTLLRAIAQLSPYQGIIDIDGIVTYNSQEPVIFNRSVYENIVYPLQLRNKNIADYKEQIDHYVERFELSHLINQNATTLSSGEKRKVSIIRSIIFEPDYVLLDEPTTHMDMDSIQELIEIIKERKTSITFIIVTHNQQLIQAVADDIYKVGEGHVSSKTN